MLALYSAEVASALAAERRRPPLRPRRRGFDSRASSSPSPFGSPSASSGSAAGSAALTGLVRGLGAGLALGWAAALGGAAGPAPLSTSTAVADVRPASSMRTTP